MGKTKTAKTSSKKQPQAKASGDGSVRRKSSQLNWADRLLQNHWFTLLFALPPLLIITWIEIPKAAIDEIPFLFAPPTSKVLFVLISAFLAFVAYSARGSYPWTWILLAINPLFIINGIHTVDFYIKAIWISTVIAATLIFSKRLTPVSNTLEFKWHELFWLGYLLIGTLAMAWSVVPRLGFERLVYLMYPVAGYLIGRRIRFWKSTVFWNVFAGVALVVSIIGMLQWWVGEGLLSFSWIMSAGLPSSTLSYRAYVSTYLVVTLPFLLWFMFSQHIKSPGHMLFATLSFVTTFVFLIYSRARSGWVGIFMALGVMFLVVMYQKVIKQKQWTWRQVLIGGLGSAAVFLMIYIIYATGKLISVIIGYGIIAFVMLVVYLYSAQQWRRNWHIVAVLTLSLTAALSVIPPNQILLERDVSVQKLRTTPKVDVVSAVSTIEAILRGGRSDRFDFWNASRRMLFEKSLRGEYEHPFKMPMWLTGAGIGQFPIYVPYYWGLLHLLGAEIHNDWVQAFVETGIVGLLFWVSVPIALLFYAFRNSHKGIMIAAIGGIFAWIFSTQTDFLTPRIYGALWVGGIAAIIYGESRMMTVIRIHLSWWKRAYPVLRRLAGLYFIWLAFGYYIMAQNDRYIYTALTQGKPPADKLVDLLFSHERFGSVWDGIGKYLIFQPISDLARAIALQMQKVQDAQQRAGFQKIQAKLAKGILEMHPYNFNAYAVLTDAAFREGRYKEALEYNNKYLEIKPDDAQMWLFKSQTLLMLGDSLEAARAAYKGLQLGPENPQALQFWQLRIAPKYREIVLQEQKQQAGTDTVRTPQVAQP